MRSGIGERQRAPCAALITPSDDGYLRLKAYSALGQGAKSFFFWTFGPTYIGTENYWSDLRSEYDGIAKLSRGLGEGRAGALSGPAGARPGGDSLLASATTCGTPTIRPASSRTG